MKIFNGPKLLATYAGGLTARPESPNPTKKQFFRDLREALDFLD